jgi:hypothetical protein
MQDPWFTTDPEERRVRIGRLLKFLFLVGFTVLLFLLAQSMVDHRFFQG